MVVVPLTAQAQPPYLDEPLQGLDPKLRQV
jgi:hypothetical protein